MNNKISVVDLEGYSIKLEKSIKGVAIKILKFLKKKNISVEIYLAGNRKMRFLNKKFLNKDKVADVLSFKEPKEFIYPNSKFDKIGEIYLNVANSQRLIINDSHKLLVHGFLHLFDFHHYKRGDRIRMEKVEQKLLLKIRSMKSLTADATH